MDSLRIVHYVNQFFGGIGGERAAGETVRVVDGPIGPGRALQPALGDKGIIVATIIAGDNYYAEQVEQASAAVRDALISIRPNVVVAGPAFDSGRYGVACAQVCRTAQELGIPAVTGMYRDNPGYTNNRRQLICVPTGTSVAEMGKVVGIMARLALKLGQGEELRGADEDGYLPRGPRKLVLHEKTGAERAVDMLVTWLNGQPFKPEIPVLTYDSVKPVPAITDLAERQIAIVTSGGLVPKGNPDRLVSARAQRYFRYAIEGLSSLAVGDWESVHGGYGNEWVNERNPNFVVPLDVLREFEAQGRFKSLYPVYFATVGNQTAIADARRMGQEIASELLNADVGAVLLVST